MNPRNSAIVVRIKDFKVNFKIAPYLFGPTVSQLFTTALFIHYRAR